MRLFEFANDDPLRVKLTAVSSQLKARYAETNSEKPLSTDAFLNILQQNDIDVEKTDLYDMVKKEPLVNIIKNINGNEVIFKGQQGSEEPEQGQGENEKIRSQMASKAIA